METIVMKKGEATRARIIEVAYQLFLEHGYHGTSMRQIADRAAITMGGVYNHFAGKEAIWEAVFLVKHPYREILPVLQRAEGETIAEFVQNAAARLVKELGRREDLLNLMFIELVEFDGQHIHELFAAILPELQRLGQVFAQKSGPLREIPLPLLARSFAGLFFSYYIMELLLPKDVRVLMGSDALHGFVNIYLYGILDESLERVYD
jgi:AcrR family transcriptional regulator